MANSTARMDSLEDTFFPNVFHEGYSDLDQHFTDSQYENEVGELAQKEPQNSTKTKPMNKKRGANFTIEEDTMLVSAWLNTSLDPIQGNEQKHHAFWMRVWEYFHENKNFTSDRNDNSLMHRWSVIQLGVNKFCGYLAQIEAAHQSGMTEEDQIREAKIMYQSLDSHKAAFQFEHCWDMLKYQPKWIQESQKKKPKRGRAAIAPEIIIDEEDVILDPELERPPMGRKKAKEERKKAKSNENASVAIVQVLNELREDRKRANEEKKQMLAMTYDLQAQKIQMEKWKEEERIMMVDTSAMNPMQQEFYHQRQMKIVESRRNKS